MLYIVKTRAEMEQNYYVRASSEKEAKKIALKNAGDMFQQTQTGKGKILAIQAIEE